MGNRYFFDCVRAHIEAAEPNGPRWNPLRSDEELRLPANLMWLCLKHHSAVDQDADTYTVELMHEWKTERESGEPSLSAFTAASEEFLRDTIDRAMTDLVAQLDGLNLPGLEVAEMLVRASEKLPDRAVADLLFEAGSLMPNEDVATMLHEAGRGLPDEDEAMSLREAASKFPNEDVAMVLLEAANAFPTNTFLSELDARIWALQSLTRGADSATGRPPSGRQQGMENGARAAAPYAQGLANPWGWFAGGAITVTIAVVGGLVGWIVLSR